MMNKKNIPYAIIGVLIAIILVLSKCNTDLKSENFIANNNIEVVQDSLTTIENKYGDVYAERGVLITDLKGLKDLNEDLYDEVKKAKKGTNIKPQVVIKYETKVVHDTIDLSTNTISLNDSLYKLDFAYDTTYTGSNSRSIAGNLFIALQQNDSLKYNNLLSKSFQITKDEMNIDATLILGQKEGDLKVWLKSDYPGFNTDAIEAVTLDPKVHPELRKINDKKFSVGPYVGIGVGEGLKLSPSIGVGVQYSIFKF